MSSPQLSVLSTSAPDVVGIVDADVSMFEQDSDFFSEYTISASLLDMLLIFLVIIASAMVYGRYTMRKRESNDAPFWSTLFHKCYNSKPVG